MNRREVIALLAATASLGTRGVHAADPESPKSLSIDGRPAGFGVYLGAGCSGTERLKAYEAWLQRDVDQTLEFISWQVLISGRAWAVNCWRKSGEENVVYSLPMVPFDRSVTLKAASDGRFDHYFRTYAEVLVKHGYGDSIIRPGWEFNANWYAWDASKDPEAWIKCWRNIVATMREVKGTSFRFDWCPAAAAGGFEADKAWPGDDVVDIVGLDFYNMPVEGRDESPQQRWETRMNMQHGLRWHRDFARRHRKPMSLPEWGSGVSTKWGGPRDDAYFIEQMAQWIDSNNFEYHNYWEYRNKEFDSKLSDGHQPLAAAAFRKSFGGQREARA